MRMGIRSFASSINLRKCVKSDPSKNTVSRRLPRFMTWYTTLPALARKVRGTCLTPCMGSAGSHARIVPKKWQMTRNAGMSPIPTPLQEMLSCHLPFHYRRPRSAIPVALVSRTHATSFPFPNSPWPLYPQHLTWFLLVITQL